MKKKKGFLKIFSTIFGITALCGFSVLFLFDTKKENLKLDAVSNISEVVNYNGNGSVDSYSFEGYIVYGNTVFTNENALIGSMKYTMKLYYTHVDSYAKLDLDFVIYNIAYKLSDGVSHNNNGVTLYGLYDGIDLGGGGVLTSFKSYRLSFGRLVYYSSSQEYELQGFIAFYTTPDASGASAFMYSFNFPFTISYNPSDNFNIPVLNGVDLNFYGDVVSSISSDLRNYYNSGLQSGLTLTSQQVYENGYQVGYDEGYEEGSSVSSESYQVGFTNGYNIGFAESESFYTSAQQTVYDNGYNSGYGQGYIDGEDSVNVGEIGLENYQAGYLDGYNEGSTQDSTVESIFAGIITVGMLPINFFLKIFNFKILGINIAAVVSALLTVAITIVILKVIFGRS